MRTIATYNHKIKAELYVAIGQFDKAITEYKHAVSDHPTDPDMYFYLGRCYNHLCQYKKAIYCFTSVIELSPTYKKAYVSKGNAHVYLDQFEKALVCYRKAVELDPYDLDTWWTIVDTLKMLGREDEAEQVHNQTKARYFRVLSGELLTQEEKQILRELNTMQPRSPLPINFSDLSVQRPISNPSDTCEEKLNQSGDMQNNS